MGEIMVWRALWLMGCGVVRCGGGLVACGGGATGCGDGMVFWPVSLSLAMAHHCRLRPDTARCVSIRLDMFCYAPQRVWGRIETYGGVSGRLGLVGRWRDVVRRSET